MRPHRSQTSSPASKTCNGMVFPADLLLEFWRAYILAMRHNPDPHDDPPKRKPRDEPGPVPTLAELRRLLALCADGAGAADPLWRRNDKRPASVLRTLQEVRREGRFALAPELRR